MSDLTLSQWIKLAGGAVRILQENGADITKLKQDLPAAIRVAHSVAGLVGAVSGSSAGDQPHAPAAAPIPTGAPVVTAPKPPAFARINAQQAADHIEANGLSDAERAMFDRASGLSTG